MTRAISMIKNSRLVLSVVALVITTVVAAGYLTFGSLQIDVFRSTYSVRIDLDQSGGLLAGRDVAIRGVRVGSVKSVGFQDGRVVAVADIDDQVKIPQDSPVRVAALSAAGEQYLDFAPSTSAGPYLRNGSVIGPGRATTPVSLTQTLTNASGVLAQMDPQKLKAIVDELGAGPQAPVKLGEIIDGGSFMISTLSDVLPETASLLRNTAVVANTVRDFGPGLRDTAAGLDRTLSGVSRSSDGFARAVTIGPEMLRSIDQIISDNSSTMVSLLGSLVSTAQVLELREPAIRHLFFPGNRGSAADALASIFHDGKVWAVINIYPRKTCSYPGPKPPTALGNFPEPYLYTDCDAQDYSQLVRGLRNVPVPEGVTNGLQPGQTPLEKTPVTPRGRYSIPLTEGDLQVPVPLPGQ